MREKSFIQQLPPALILRRHGPRVGQQIGEFDTLLGNQRMRGSCDHRDMIVHEYFGGEIAVRDARPTADGEIELSPPQGGYQTVDQPLGDGQTYSGALQAHAPRSGRHEFGCDTGSNSDGDLAAHGTTQPGNFQLGTAGKRMDLDLYAQVVRHAVSAGRRVADGVSFLIQYGSRDVQEYARQRGYDALFQGAGVRLIHPGCGACIGCGPGTSHSDSQVTVSAINRNFKGRSGPGSLWLASPLTVAASAFEGRITAWSPDLWRDPHG